MSQNQPDPSSQPGGLPATGSQHKKKNENAAQRAKGWFDRHPRIGKITKGVSAVSKILVTGGISLSVGMAAAAFLAARGVPDAVKLGAAAGTATATLITGASGSIWGSAKKKLGVADPTTSDLLEKFDLLASRVDGLERTTELLRQENLQFRIENVRLREENARLRKDQVDLSDWAKFAHQELTGLRTERTRDEQPTRRAKPGSSMPGPANPEIPPGPVLNELHASSEGPKRATKKTADEAEATKPKEGFAATDDTSPDQSADNKPGKSRKPKGP
jgi:hypothetical protein